MRLAGAIPDLAGSSRRETLAPLGDSSAAIRSCGAASTPAYAPVLNPVETVWSCAKRADLANLAADDLFDVGDAAEESLARQRRDLRIRRSYFKTAKLPL